MRQLINDLLNYSRLGRQKVSLTPTDVGAVVDEALANVGIALKESSGAVNTGELPTVMGNPGLLRRLFQNLIGNAIKYRGEAAPVIHISARSEGPDWVFAVKDNGIGIKPNHFERIFLIFQRLHRRGEYEGTGIGLTIAKKIVEHHGGRIWVESVEGEGTSFLFTIPTSPTIEPRA